MMANFVQRILDIEASEQTPVLLLLANSFFIGVFIVTYDVAASSLFLDTFGKEFLTRLPIFTGALGMISTSIFAFFQRRVKFTNLALVCFLIIILLAGGMYYGLQVYGLKWMKFTAFLLLGPINAIFLLCFYGTVARSFSLKREKHMTNTVDQGQMIATAISFFAVYFVSPYIPEVTDFFIVSIFSGVMAFVFMLMFVMAHGRRQQRADSLKNRSEVVKFKDMINNPYIRMLCLLFLGSVLATIFLEYSFLSVTVQKYTNENDLARFLGVFGGFVTVFSFILQTFVADWAIKTYGPRLGLILIPTLLGLFAVLASLIGTFFGYTSEAPSFMLFFLFLAMSKLFLQSLREAFEDPIVKTLFIPLDSKSRFDVQIKVEGFFKEFSGFLAGTLLTIIGLIRFFDLIFFSYILIGICCFYAFIVIKLFVEYRKTLTNTLVAQNQKGDEFLDNKDYEITDVLKKELENDNPDTVIYTLKLLERIEPLLANEKFIDFMEDQNPKLREYSILRLEANKAISAIEDIKKRLSTEIEPSVKTLAQSALDNLNETDSIQITTNFTYYLTKSRKVEDRIYAAHLISKTREDSFLPQLLILLRDVEPRVRFAAMVTAAKVDKHETWPILIEYLGSYTFTNVAAAAIIAYGERILPALEAAFYKTGQSEAIQEKIVQIYGRIQGDEVIELLWNKIDLPNKKIVNNVLLCLSSCGFRPYGERIIRIKQSIETDIGNSAWVIAALTEIPKEGNDYLKNALEEELQFNFENIYMLLALIYDPQAIKLVKDNIQSGTVEGLVYAIELLDVFLAEEIKPILFPLLEDIPQSERNERLQGHFPRQKLDEVEVLKQIINRDYNSINKWSKACALYAYGSNPQNTMTDDLTANLFNPDQLLREVAGWAIYQKDKSLYYKNTLRLADNIRKEIDAVTLPTNEHDGHQLHISRIEKIFFLKTLDAFKNVPGVVLVEFVDLVEEVKFHKNEIILKRGANGEAPLYIIYQGQAIISDGENDVVALLQSKDLIGEMLILDSDTNEYTITADEDSILFRIDKNRFFEQINDNFEIAKELIKVISRRNAPHVVLEDEISSDIN